MSDGSEALPGAEKDASVADSFANAVLIDWNHAMSEFFNVVDRKRRQRDLTGKQVRAALHRGYGIEIADEWDEWFGQGDSDDD